LRAGHQNDLSYLISFVKKIEDAGAQWVTLHPRTTEQKRRGSADWSQIREVRNSVKIPVIGNGDIQTAGDVFRLLNETGCDLAMAGRALTARPWLFWQIGEKLGMPNPTGRASNERAPQTPEEEGAEYGRVLRRLLQLMTASFSEDLALRKFRFFV